MGAGTIFKQISCPNYSSVFPLSATATRVVLGINILCHSFFVLLPCPYSSRTRHQTYMPRVYAIATARRIRYQVLAARSTSRRKKWVLSCRPMPTSGRWFTGKHTPLISKDLFDDVQKQLHLQIKAHGKNKEFSFTRILSCGACGSGVTAQEKYKNLKDGSVAKYIYYGCTRARDINCKEGYIEEKVLIFQLLEIIDKIDLDQSSIKKKLEAEIERHKKFHSGIMGKAEEIYHAKDADIRNYAKYLLTEGSMFEKRDLLQCLKSKLILKNKSLLLF